MLHSARFRRWTTVLGLSIALLPGAGCSNRHAAGCDSPDKGDYVIAVSLQSPSSLGDLQVSKTGGYTHHGAELTIRTTDGSLLQVKMPAVGPNPYPHPQSMPGQTVWLSGQLDTALADCTSVQYTVELKKDATAKILTGRIIINR